MSTPEYLRARNLVILVDALRNRGSISRSELARVTGLSRTTVISIVDELEMQGFIVERNAGQTGDRGRPPALIGLHPSAGLVLGVFVGRDDMRVALVDLSLAVLADRHARFPLDTPAEPLMELIGRLVDGTLGDAGKSREDLIGVGLGLPNPIDPAAGTVDPDILENWAGRDVADDLGTLLGVPVTVENDANLEAVAEVAMGAGEGFRNVVYVKLSWGIGGAIVIDGRLRRGNTGYAGELAHIRVRDDGPVCRCGRRGCLGSFASGHVLVEALEGLHGPGLDLDAVLGLVASGDAGAQRLFRDAGWEIGVVLAGIGNCLNPDAFVVGGDLGLRESPLHEGIRAAVGDGALPSAPPAPVIPAALGPTGGALGAATLVVRSQAVLDHFVRM
jgi:predicted NBD/HSP70 family sugar kinase